MFCERYVRRYSEVQKAIPATCVPLSQLPLMALSQQPSEQEALISYVSLNNQLAGKQSAIRR
jgi:hypothetical protein